MMKQRNYVALAIGCAWIAMVGLEAQSTPPAVPQKPPSSQPAQKPADANPFPEDTGNIPIVPTGAQPSSPSPQPSPDEGSAATTSLLTSDTDPVHSPDDPAPGVSASDSGFSSSLSGAGDVNIPDEERPEKRRRSDQPPKTHLETAKEDEDVGAFELGRKNWKAALSRYQSALIGDSENPDVYWGIAEAQRQMGEYANARTNYQKVVDFDDPESKHSKEARKLLKSPQLANATPVAGKTIADPDGPKN